MECVDVDSHKEDDSNSPADFDIVESTQPRKKSRMDDVDVESSASQLQATPAFPLQEQSNSMDLVMEVVDSKTVENEVDVMEVRQIENLTKLKLMLAEVSAVHKQQFEFNVSKMFCENGSQADEYQEIDNDQAVSQLLCMKRYVLHEKMKNAKNRGILKGCSICYGFGEKCVILWNKLEPLLVVEIQLNAKPELVTDIVLSIRETKQFGLLIATNNTISLHTLDEWPNVNQSAEIENFGTLCVAYTNSGRVFIGSKDGSIKELSYSSFWGRNVVTKYAGQNDASILKLIFFKDNIHLLAFSSLGDIIIFNVKENNMVALASMRKCEYTKAALNFFPACELNIGDAVSIDIEDTVRSNTKAIILTTSSALRLVIEISMEAEKPKVLTVRAVRKPPKIEIKMPGCLPSVLWTTKVAYLNGTFLMVVKVNKEVSKFLVCNALLSNKDSWTETVEISSTQYASTPEVSLFESADSTSCNGVNEKISFCVLGSDTLETYEVGKARTLFDRALLHSEPTLPLRILNNEDICTFALQDMVSADTEDKLNQSLKLFDQYGSQGANYTLLKKKVSPRLIGLIQTIFELLECKQPRLVDCLHSQAENPSGSALGAAQVTIVKEGLEKLVATMEKIGYLDKESLCPQTDKLLLKYANLFLSYAIQGCWFLNHLHVTQMYKMCAEKLDKNTILDCLLDFLTLPKLAQHIINMQMKLPGACVDATISLFASKCPMIYNNVLVAQTRVSNTLNMAEKEVDWQKILKMKDEAVSLISFVGPKMILENPLIVKQLVKVCSPELVLLVGLFTKMSKDKEEIKQLLLLLTNLINKMREDKKMIEARMLVQCGLKFTLIRKEMFTYLWDKDILQQELEFDQHSLENLEKFLQEKQKNHCAGTEEWIKAVTHLVWLHLKSHQKRKACDVLFNSATNEDVNIQLSTRQMLLERLIELEMYSSSSRKTKFEEAREQLNIIKMQSGALAEAKSFGETDVNLESLMFKSLTKVDLKKETERLGLVKSRLLIVSLDDDLFDEDLCKNLWKLMLDECSGLDSKMQMVLNIGQQIKPQYLPMEILAIKLETTAVGEETAKEKVCSALAGLTSYDQVFATYKAVLEKKMLEDKWLLRHFVACTVTLARIILGYGIGCQDMSEVLEMCQKLILLENSSASKTVLMEIACCKLIAKQ